MNKFGISEELKNDLSNVTYLGRQKILNIIGDQFIDQITQKLKAEIMPALTITSVNTYSTKAELNNVIDMQIGDVSIVLNDESTTNFKETYIYSSSSQWEIIEDSQILNNLKDVVINSIANNHALIYNSASQKFENKLINHLNLTNIGTNTHAQIDTHIDNSDNIHFQESSIDHDNILNNGTYTHGDIDYHINNDEIHLDHTLTAPTNNQILIYDTDHFKNVDRYIYEDVSINQYIFNSDNGKKFKITSNDIILTIRLNSIANYEDNFKINIYCDYDNCKIQFEPEITLKTTTNNYYLGKNNHLFRLSSDYWILDNSNNVYQNKIKNLLTCGNLSTALASNTQIYANLSAKTDYLHFTYGNGTRRYYGNINTSTGSTNVITSDVSYLYGCPLFIINTDIYCTEYNGTTLIKMFKSTNNLTSFSVSEIVINDSKTGYTPSDIFYDSTMGKLIICYINLSNNLYFNAVNISDLTITYYDMNETISNISGKILAFYHLSRPIVIWSNGSRLYGKIASIGAFNSNWSSVSSFYIDDTDTIDNCKNYNKEGIYTFIKYNSTTLNIMQVSELLNGFISLVSIPINSNNFNPQSIIRSNYVYICLNHEIMPNIHGGSIIMYDLENNKIYLNENVLNLNENNTANKKLCIMARVNNGLQILGISENSTIINCNLLKNINFS
jgi:hypothetical protein